MPGLQCSAVQTALDAPTFDAIAPRMLCLMLRNVAGADYRFVDPWDASISAEIRGRRDDASRLEKSVRNLTGSYSSFLSAVRARAEAPSRRPRRRR